MKQPTRLSQYRSRKVELIKVTHEPNGHETYAWVSQNGKVTLICDMDDRHLTNIYRILKKSDDYFSNLSPDTNTFDAYYENKERLNHVEFEIHIRGLIIPEIELYKIIKVKTLFELLNMGCQIQFPNGYVLKGDPKSGYIDTDIIIAGELVQDGLRPLDETGAADALNDAITYNPEES